MRVANIDLDIQAAKILIDTLSMLISGAEK